MSQMMKNAFALALIGLSAMLCCPKLVAKQPNVLVLIADDQRSDTIAALGNPDIETPSLDRLAKAGFNVSSMYCLGSNSGAVCQPSRNMMLSGRSYFRWTPPGDQATYAPADDTTLPAVFNKAGYETYHHGKRGNTATLIHKQFKHSKYVDDFDARWSGQPGQEIVDDAINHLKLRSEDKPWLMWLEFAVPHDPRYAAKEYLARYTGRQIKLPKNVLPMHPFDNGSVLVRDEWTALWPRSEQALQDEWQDYYATITGFDHQIGRFIDHLEKRDELKDTIVVFTSDHGLGMGSHGLMGKQNVYESGYKAPCIFAGPGIARGACDDPVYLMDIYPTLCELCGIEQPQGLDGRSFASMLMSKSGGPRDAVMLSYQDSQRAVRQGDWKWIVYPQVDKEQLFNLKDDAQEIHDLSSASDQQDRIGGLKLKLADLQKEFGDSAKLTAANSRSSVLDMPTFVIADEKLTAEFVTNLTISKHVGGGLGAISRTFGVGLKPNEHFTAIAVGHDRDASYQITGLRFDIVSPDAGRRIVIAGDANSRWSPLLDGLSEKLQPVGIYGHDKGPIESLGFILSDRHRSPAFGRVTSTRLFESPTEKDAELLTRKLVGFMGVFTRVGHVEHLQTITLAYDRDKASGYK